MDRFYENLYWVLITEISARTQILFKIGQK